MGLVHVTEYNLIESMIDRDHKVSPFILIHILPEIGRDHKLMLTQHWSTFIDPYSLKLSLAFMAIFIEYSILLNIPLIICLLR